MSARAAGRGARAPSRAPPGRAGPGLLTSGLGRQVPADAGLGPAGSRWRRAGGAGRRARAVRPAARLPLGNRGKRASVAASGRGGGGRRGAEGREGRRGWWPGQVAGAQAGAGPAGQGRDARLPGVRGARPHLRRVGAAESRRKSLGAEVSRARPGFVRAGARHTRRGGPPSGAGGPGRPGAGRGRRRTGAKMPTRFRRPMGALGPGQGRPGRTPASHLCGGRRQGGPGGERPAGALRGQRQEGRDRQRARAPSCAGTWWRGLFWRRGGTLVLFRPKEPLPIAAPHRAFWGLGSPGLIRYWLYLLSEPRRGRAGKFLSLQGGSGWRGSRERKPLVVVGRSRSPGRAAQGAGGWPRGQLSALSSRLTPHST